MPLLPGTKFGPYEIVAPLGAGGMGENYRARDARLQRDVALKVLPASVSEDRDRLARFEREAHLLAALNHPHIAGIYGLEGAGQTQCLVLELVEGENLAERLKRGPLPIDEALPIARQLADALGAAHEKGIIHRDLKPANIALTLPANTPAHVRDLIQRCLKKDRKERITDIAVAQFLSCRAETGTHARQSRRSPPSVLHLRRRPRECSRTASATR